MVSTRSSRKLSFSPPKRICSERIRGLYFSVRPHRLADSSPATTLTWGVSRWAPAYRTRGIPDCLLTPQNFPVYTDAHSKSHYSVWPFAPPFALVRVPCRRFRPVDHLASHAEYRPGLLWQLRRFQSRHQEHPAVEPARPAGPLHRKHDSPRIPSAKRAMSTGTLRLRSS